MPGPGIAPDPAIVHFINVDKPWHWSNEHRFKSEYHKYRLKTLWAQYELQDKPSVQGKASPCASSGRKGRTAGWLAAMAADQLLS